MLELFKLFSFSFTFDKVGGEIVSIIQFKLVYMRCIFTIQQFFISLEDEPEMQLSDGMLESEAVDGEEGTEDIDEDELENESLDSQNDDSIDSFSSGELNLNICTNHQIYKYIVFKSYIEQSSRL